MRKIVISLFAAAVLLSCGIQELGTDADEGGRRVHTGIWGGSVEGQGGIGVLQSVCYMTVLDYKKGYNWRSDLAKGSVKCSLLVYADGRLVMKVPVGDEYEMSSDPDMHRVIKGHLYTDYSTETETVIRRDGELLFTYPGREYIRGMDVVGEDVYTLGQSRQGGGFTYRKNGEVVLERGKAELIGQLRRDEESLCFAFKEAVSTSEGQTMRYYRVVDGKVHQVAFKGEVLKVFDMLPTPDDAYYIALHKGDDYPHLCFGLSTLIDFRAYGKEMLSGTIHYDKGAVAITFLCKDVGGQEKSWLWEGGFFLQDLPAGMTYTAFQIYGLRDYAYASNPARPSAQGLIYNDNAKTQIPAGYVLMGQEALCNVNETLYVGLSSTKGNRPVLWKDGQIDSLDVNGYIATISCDKVE